MENINWICKAKTVNNNIVWMCSPKIKEHFESSRPGALEGSTKLPAAIDITLGPANFGPTEEFCKDTTGFTKLGEWKMKFDNMPQYNNSHLNNGEFWNVRKDVGKNGDWSGDDFMPDGGAWNQWLGFSVVDANGVNTQPAFMEVQIYQEFTSKWFVLIRNKSNPNSYYLMSKVNIVSFKYIANADSDTYLVYRDGYGRRSNPIDKTRFYDNLNVPVEVFFSGQSGGTPIENSIYEVFIKPFVRSTYPYKGDPGNSGPPPTLASDLSSKLFLWFDANDPNGDGNNNFNDNEPVTYWKDKSKNQIKMMRMPFLQQDIFMDDVKSVDGIPGGHMGGVRWGGAKERLPRIKKNFKNGLSVIRLNGLNGFVPMINNDDNTKKFMAAYGNHNNPPIPNYTIVLVHYLTEFTMHGSNLFSLGPWGAYNDSSLVFQFTNHSGIGSPTFSIYNGSSISVYPGNLLNKWAITTITKNNVIQTYINGTLTPPGLIHGKPFDSNSGIIRGAYWLKIGDRDNGFAGDIGEILYFNNPLSDDERQKVEGYLGVKWNLTSLLPTSNPYAIDTVNSAQLFTGTNYGATSNYFSVGRYNNSQLKQIGAKTLQSLKIPSGLQVLLYQNGDFTGLAKSIIADTPDLSSVTDSRNTGFKWNNQMQSLIVQKFIPLPTSISANMPAISLISSDANSFLSTVKDAVLTRIDGKDYLFVDPNNKDNVFWYNASDLMVTPPSVTNPSINIKSIPKITQWFDAMDPLNNGTLPSDGTQITTWKDKSGNGHDLTKYNNYPLPNFKQKGINSLPTIDFTNQSGLYTQNAFTKSKDVTLFLVAMVKSELRAFATFWGHYVDHDADIQLRNNGTQSLMTWHTNNQNDIGTQILMDSPVMYSCTMKDGTNMFMQQTNTSGTTSKKFTENLTFRDGLGKVFVGMEDDANYTNSYISEIIYIQSVLEEADRQKVEGYLAWKWGLNSNLPNNHPYFTKSP